MSSSPNQAPLRSRSSGEPSISFCLFLFLKFGSYAFALFVYDPRTVMITSHFILFQREGLSFSNWDKWVVKGAQDYKLKSFLKYFKVSTQILWMRIAILWARNQAEIF